MKAKASGRGQVAPDKADAGRAVAAGGSAFAAARLAHGAADNLTSTARYLRDLDMNAIVKDIRSFVSQNPGAALLGVGVIGFLLGRAFSSRD